MPRTPRRTAIGLMVCGLLGMWTAAIAGAQEPTEREVLMLGARNAWRLGAYDQAIARYRLAIERDPTQWDAVEELGWLLLAIGRTDEAIRQFEAATTLAPDNLTVWRNRARAYGWAFAYEPALDTFDVILKRFPSDAATELERNGKRALWLGRLRPAQAAFERLAELEPNNTEALFDLAQIAAQRERPWQAQALYRRLLAVAPEHRRAALGLELNTRLQQPLLMLDYAFIDQQGYDGKRSIRYGLGSAEGRVRISDTVSARLGYQNAQFHFGHDSLLAHAGTVGLGYHPNSFLQFTGFVSGLHYDRTDRDRINLGVGVSYETLSGLTLRADFERKDLWENRTTVLDGIVTHRFSTSVRGVVGQRLEWTIQGDFTDYSDNNTRIGGEFLAAYRLLWFPTSLRLIYRVNGFGFQRERAYFSPSAYATNTLAVEWQHRLGYPTHKDYLAEAPRNAYSIYYGISIDSNGIPFNEWRGRFAYALAPQLDVGLSLKTIRSTVYNEWGAQGSIGYTF
ncbi:MAG: hypothetical protein C3F12_05535 [Candidatus Methylomirabilota bacterium]|nr:tetratricopeptide repeat protein [candidate division NC10 bacterium]PWB47431.1 MAG: hypothetical protein C3F12_05535 [candidate division NC10 bacterium]